MCINNADERVLTQDQEILNRWMIGWSIFPNSLTRYLQEGQMLEIILVGLKDTGCFNRRIGVEEVNEVVRKMKS